MLLTVRSRKDFHRKKKEVVWLFGLKIYLRLRSTNAAAIATIMTMTAARTMYMSVEGACAGAGAADGVLVDVGAGDAVEDAEPTATEVSPYEG